MEELDDKTNFKTNEIVDSNSGLETTTVDNNLEE